LNRAVSGAFPKLAAALTLFLLRAEVRPALTKANEKAASPPCTRSCGLSRSPRAASTCATAAPDDVIRGNDAVVRVDPDGTVTQIQGSRRLLAASPDLEPES
jgi:hypothetical protein